MRRKNPIRNSRASFLESKLKQDRKADFCHLAELVTALLSYLAQEMIYFSAFISSASSSFTFFPTFWMSRFSAPSLSHKLSRLCLIF